MAMSNLWIDLCLSLQTLAVMIGRILSLEDVSVTLCVLA